MTTIKPLNPNTQKTTDQRAKRAEYTRIYQEKIEKANLYWKEGWAKSDSIANIGFQTFDTIQINKAKELSKYYREESLRMCEEAAKEYTEALKNIK